MARYGYPQRRTAAPPPPPPTGTKKVTLTARITPEARDKAHLVADALGISLSALVLELLERIEVDAQGHPGWESKYAPPDDEHQEQLEMTA